MYIYLCCIYFFSYHGDSVAEGYSGSQDQIKVTIVMGLKINILDFFLITKELGHKTCKHLLGSAAHWSVSLFMQKSPPSQNKLNTLSKIRRWLCKGTSLAVLLSPISKCPSHVHLTDRRMCWECQRVYQHERNANSTKSVFQILTNSPFILFLICQGK